MFTEKLIFISALLAVKVVAAPISAIDASDFASNVLMTSGAAQFAVWVPTDATSHSSADLTCLNVGASSVGACNIPSIDQVAVISGYTCMFSGSNGWSGVQTGTDETGWLSVAPPQTITSMACMT